MKIFLARQLFRVGDIDFNYKKTIEIYDKCLKDGCDLLVFPEMSITGFPIYDQLLDMNFIKKSDEYVEKIVDYTKGKKTRIVLGCPYFVEGINSDEKITKSQLFNAMILINDGYIDAVSSKTVISKQNLFDEYRYFDAEFVLKSMTYENDNFDILVSDEIGENKNIFYIKERDTDFVICLDTEIEKNIASKKKQLSKIAKWTKKNIIYLNNLGYDFKNDYRFFGEIFVLNRGGEIVYKNLALREDVIKLETSIVDGDIVINSMEQNDSDGRNFLDIIAENYADRTIVFEAKKKADCNFKAKNLKAVTFDKNFTGKNVQYINVDDYLKNLILDDNLKHSILNNIFAKPMVIK